MILFGLAILFQPKGRIVLNKGVNLASLVAAAGYASFIIYMSIFPIHGGTNSLDPGFRSNRPFILPLAVLEWIVFFSTILWIAAIAMAGRKKQNTVVSQTTS